MADKLYAARDTTTKKHGAVIVTHPTSSISRRIARTAAHEWTEGARVNENTKIC